MKQIFFTLLAGFFLLAGSNITSAQDKADFLKTSVVFKETDKTDKKDKKSAVDKKDEEATAAEAETAKAAAQTSAGCESCRWFEPTVASFSMRYRTTTDSNDLKGLNQGQQRTLLGAKFKFDKEGKYTLNVHASSGYYFNWAYADTGLGNVVNESIRGSAAGIANVVTREVAPGAIQGAVQNYITANFPNATAAQIAQLTPALTAQFTPIVTPQVTSAIQNQLTNINTRTKGWNLFVRQLYFQAKPVKGLELSYGSMPINKGVNSESTAYDDDGYVSGGRVAVKRPDKFFFDEVSVTYAYLGDIFTPNFFRRTERFKQSNYHQFLVRKKLFNNRVDASTDYTFQDGSDTMREAVSIKTPELKFVDNIKVEAYQRVGDNVIRGKNFKAGNGFYIQGEKTIAKKLTLNAGVANIDRHYTVYGEYSSTSLDWFGFALNGDQTGVGKRFIGKANYKITKDLSVSTMYSQAFNNNAEDMRYYWNKTHFNVAVTYDILEGAKRLGWFR